MSTNLKAQLIRLGYDAPELREDLRPVLAELDHTNKTRHSRDIASWISDATKQLDLLRAHTKQASRDVSASNPEVEFSEQLQKLLPETTNKQRSGQDITLGWEVEMRGWVAQDAVYAEIQGGFSDGVLVEILSTKGSGPGGKVYSRSTPRTHPSLS